MRSSNDPSAGLIHTVFFSLANSSESARAELASACHKYLAGHPGIVHFSVGVVAETLDRQVNVRDFDVSLHIIFANLAAHERYQTDQRHLEFLAENSAKWKSVRVFDSVLQ
jgi:hypothetical protein